MVVGVRRNMLVGFICMMSVVCGWWGVRRRLPCMLLWAIDGVVDHIAVGSAYNSDGLVHVGTDAWSSIHYK